MTFPSEFEIEMHSLLMVLHSLVTGQEQPSALDKQHEYQNRKAFTICPSALAHILLFVLLMLSGVFF